MLSRAARHAARCPNRLSTLPGDLLILVLQSILGINRRRSTSWCVRRHHDLCALRLVCKAIMEVELSSEAKLWSMLTTRRWDDVKIGSVRSRVNNRDLYAILHLREEKPGGLRANLWPCIEEAFSFTVEFASADGQRTPPVKVDFFGRHGFQLCHFDSSFDFMPASMTVRARRADRGGDEAVLVHVDIPWDEHHQQLDGRRYLTLLLRAEPAWADEPLEIDLTLVRQPVTRGTIRRGGQWAGCQFNWSELSREARGKRLGLGTLWAALCKQIF